MRVHLNGGPLHDHFVDVPDDKNHFHIMEPVTEAVKRALDDATPTKWFQQLPLREGMYSQVTGPNNRHEFEWDGWRSHD